MNKKGFANIILVLVIVALAGAGTYFVSIRQSAPPTPNPTPASSTLPSSVSNPASIPTPSTTPTPVQPAQNANVLSVLDLTRNKEAYVGKRVRVQGKIVVNVFYSAEPCLSDGSACDTTIGAQLELRQPNTVYQLDNILLLFTKNQPYPCNKTAPKTYTCPPYINNQITTIEGIWSKDQVPIQSVSSSGGGSPTTIKWGDRYFLDIQ